jgi:hypothetical protein
MKLAGIIALISLEMIPVFQNVKSFVSVQKGVGWGWQSFVLF